MGSEEIVLKFHMYECCYRNCEDLAMQFAVAIASGVPPIAIHSLSGQTQQKLAFTACSALRRLQEIVRCPACHLWLSSPRRRLELMESLLHILVDFHHGCLIAAAIA
eukprot:scaffold203874_cov39-Prasinocladus_malaysianus.AAC.1